MRLLLYCLLLQLISYTDANAQYKGGTADGHALNLSFSKNSLADIYNGGSNDGMVQLLSVLQNTLEDIYRGSSNDGYSIAGSNSNRSATVYNGGINDGFNTVTLSAQHSLISIYTGGQDDGFYVMDKNLLNPLPPIYSGGIADGFSKMICIRQNELSQIYVGGSSDGWGTLVVPNGEVPVTYVFTGTGNWNNAANWLNNLIPPSPLPAGSEIIINPSGADCILNAAQVLLPGSKLTIAAGKIFIVPAIN